MFDNLFFYTFMFISMLHITHIGMYIVGANLYDVRQFMTLRRNKQKRPRTPLVSVVIPAYNEEIGIIKTLDSVRASSYRRVQIIVVDDGSRDATAEVVQKYIRTHYRLDSKVDTKPGTRIARSRRRRKVTKPMEIVLISQQNSGKGAAVNNGIKNAARGSLVMTLDADSVLDKNAIKNAVRYFEDPKIVGVAANVRVLGDRNALGVLQKIEHIIGYRTKKFYTVANCEFVVGGVASTYRMKTLREVGFYDTDTLTEDIGLSLKVVARKGNRDWRIVYAADVLAGTEGVQTYRALFKQRYRWKMGMLQNLIKNRSLLVSTNKKYGKMLTLYRIPMAFMGEIILLVEPFILGYVLYLSVLHTSVGALLGAYLIVTLYVIWALVPDEHMPAREKLKYALLSPAMYFIFYIMNAVQVAAVVRCLFHYKLVIGKVRTDGRWTPPERAAVIAKAAATPHPVSAEVPTLHHIAATADEVPVRGHDEDAHAVGAIGLAASLAVDQSTADSGVQPHEPSKHRAYFLKLQETVASIADVQTKWHEYYARLSEREKLEVWQEFYAVQSRHTSVVDSSTTSSQDPVQRGDATHDVNQDSLPSTQALAT